MFRYCIHVLHLSEPEAYLRIVAARAARKHPVLLAMLADGRLHLSGIAKLAPHLTRENRDALLGRATHRVQAPDRGADRRDLSAARRALARAEAARRNGPGAASAPGARSRRWRGPSRRSVLPPRQARRRNESSSTWPGSARRGKAREACRHSFRWPEPRPQAGRNSVRAESAPRATSSSRSLPPATRCSSRRAHSSKTSSSGSRPCCAPRFPTATWPRSSSGP